MVVIGIDAHKRTHTAVMVDRTGQQLAVKTEGTTSSDHLALLRWATAHGADRAWAIEDCRNLSRRLERDLIAAGEQVVQVPPKLVCSERPVSVQPRRWATTAASIRLWTPSLARMLETWTLAVLGLMNSAWAICRLLRPAPIRASTSVSRG